MGNQRGEASIFTQLDGRELQSHTARFDRITDRNDKACWLSRADWLARATPVQFDGTPDDRHLAGARQVRPLGSGQAVRRLTLDQEIEGSNPSSPANLLPAPLLLTVWILKFPYSWLRSGAETRSPGKASGVPCVAA